jgi:predicted nucleotidyltransferase
MPVRSLNSSVLVWPDRIQVDRAVRLWAARAAKTQPQVRRLGYFGSYARGDWGVGSDLDLVAIVATAPEPFAQRPLSWDLTSLPVPAEILIYTEPEWHALEARGSRFAQTLAREIVWVFPSNNVIQTSVEFS